MGRSFQSVEHLELLLRMNKSLLFIFCLVLIFGFYLSSTECKKIKKNGSEKDVEKSPGREMQKEKKKKPGRRAKKRTVKKKKKRTQKKKRNGRKKSGRNGLKKRRPKKCSPRQSSSFCPAEKAQTMNLLINKVANFFKQLKRSEQWRDLVGKKKAKKEDFASDAAVLTDAVGGDVANPSCASSRAAASRSASDVGQTLKNCSTSIGAACGDVTIDSAVATDCKTKMEAFQSKVTTCKTDDSCTCWTEALAMKGDLSCSSATTAEMNRVKGLKDSCLSKFGDCKRAQDGAVEFTATCPGASMMTTARTVKRKWLLDMVARNRVFKRNQLIK